MKKLSLLLLFFALAGMVTGCTATQETLQLTCLNVGKADCTVLQCDGHAILLDAAEDSSSDDILAFLKQQHITRLDAMIITHFDKDHVGSAAKILTALPVQTVYSTDRYKNNQACDAFLQALTDTQTQHQILTRDTQLQYGALQLTLLPPQAANYDEKASNNGSILVTASYKQTNFLFMADACDARIKEFLSDNTQTFDFMKVPYHGNVLDENPALFEAVQAASAVICCADNQPDPKDVDKTIRQLQAAGTRVYCTKDGSIEATSDGTTVLVSQS